MNMCVESSEERMGVSWVGFARRPWKPSPGGWWQRDPGPGSGEEDIQVLPDSWGSLSWGQATPSTNILNEIFIDGLWNASDEVTKGFSVILLLLS